MTKKRDVDPWIVLTYVQEADAGAARRIEEGLCALLPDWGDRIYVRPPADLAALPPAPGGFLLVVAGPSWFEADAAGRRPCEDPADPQGRPAVMRTVEAVVTASRDPSEDAPGILLLLADGAQLPAPVEQAMWLREVPTQRFGDNLTPLVDLLVERPPISQKIEWSDVTTWFRSLKKPPWLRLAVVLLILSFLIYRFLEGPLRNRVGRLGMTSLTLAWTAGKAHAILDAWTTVPAPTEQDPDPVQPTRFAGQRENTGLPRPWAVLVVGTLGILAWTSALRSTARNGARWVEERRLQGVTPAEQRHACSLLPEKRAALERLVAALKQQGRRMAWLVVLAAGLALAENIYLGVLTAFWPGIPRHALSVAAHVFTAVAALRYGLVFLALLFAGVVFYQTQAARVQAAAGDVWRVAVLCRFSLFMVLLLMVLLPLNQPQDALRVLFFDAAAGANWTRLLFAFLGILGLSLTGWYLARVLLGVQMRHPHLRWDGARFQTTLWQDAAARHLPRFCAWMPFVLVGMNLFAASRPLQDTNPRIFQAMIVAGSVCLIVAVLVAVLLYKRRQILEALWQVAETGVPCSHNPATLGRRQYLLWIIPLLVFAAVGIAVFSVTLPEDSTRWGRALRAAGLAALFAALYAYLLRRWAIRTFSPGTVVGLTMIFSADVFLTAWLWGSEHQASSVLGALAVLFLGLAGVIPFGTLLVHIAETSRVPVFTILLLAAGLFALLGTNDNHTIRYWVVPDGTQIARLDGNNPTTLEDDVALLAQRREAEAQRRAGDEPLSAFDNAFIAWLKARAGNHERGALPQPAPPAPYPVVLVAAEGGGIRAAYQTAIALSKLQDASLTRGHPAGRDDFARHVFAMSGVSGGSIGIATFAALARLADAEQEPGKPAATLPGYVNWSEATDRILSQDMLSQPLAALLYSETWQWLIPLPLAHREPINAAMRSRVTDAVEYVGVCDRARPIEIAFERAWRDAFPHQANYLTQSLDVYSEGFALLQGVDIPAPESSNPVRRVPALFFNTSRVESGDRMVVATIPPPLLHERDALGKDEKGDDELPPYALRARSRFYQGTQDPKALTTLASLNPQIDLRLSTAAFMSARFLYISPAAGVPLFDRQWRGDATPEDCIERGRYRYVDGGYFENSGTDTLDDILRALLRLRTLGRAGQVKIPDFRLVILRIGYSYDEEPPGELGRDNVPFDEPIAPLITIYNARDGRARAAVAALRADVEALRLQEQQEGRAENHRSRFLDMTFQQRPVLPLGWLLSHRAAAELKRQADTLPYRDPETPPEREPGQRMVDKMCKILGLPASGQAEAAPGAPGRRSLGIRTGNARPAATSTLGIHDR